MEIERLKKIPIAALLSHLGHEPVSRMRGGRQLMYYSPLRGDSNPSFSVSVDKNLWFDFGLSVGGNVIDLAIAMRGGCSFHEAAVWLENQSLSAGFYNSSPVVFDHHQQHRRESEMESVKVVPLAKKSLYSYLSSRCIPPDLGRRYCKEVHYTVRGKQYYGVCFMNILGGMEIRNPFFKGSYGVKAPSIITIEKEKRTGACCVFEGFMDFLSYKVLERCDKEITLPLPCDCIILNSTALVKKSAAFIDVYEKAYCYLDNDNAGIKASALLEELMPGKIELCSEKYRGYNDLNDYLAKKPKSR